MTARLSELTFGSYLVYPSRADTDETARYKEAILSIKTDRFVHGQNMRWPEYTARRLHEKSPGTALEGFFGEDSILVPLPRSGLLQKNALWPAKRIAEELVKCGLGQRVEPIVQRETAMRKSATSEGRPSPAEHLKSFSRVLPVQPPKIVLVDDIITRGSTALAAAWAILEAMPEAEVKSFAIARTIGDEPADIVDIVVGKVVHEGGNFLHREP